jgi:hypothetical protein
MESKQQLQISTNHNVIINTMESKQQLQISTNSSFYTNCNNFNNKKKQPCLALPSNSTSYVCPTTSYLMSPLHAYSALGHPSSVANLFHIAHKQT